MPGGRAPRRSRGDLIACTLAVEDGDDTNTKAKSPQTNDLPLFELTAEHGSGTGWPSFFDAIPCRLGTVVDYTQVFDS